MAMSKQRRINSAEGAKTVRRAFSLVRQLEIEVTNLESAGVAPSSARSTLDFCTRCIVGFPGAWQSRPEVQKQFPEKELNLLESLGTIITMYNGGVVDLPADKISALLDEIDEALTEAPLPEVLDKYIRRLIAEIRNALLNADEFSSAEVAEQLFQLGVATKAAEAAIDDPEKKKKWAGFWPHFFTTSMSAVAVEGVKTVFGMLPM